MAHVAGLDAGAVANGCALDSHAHSNQFCSPVAAYVYGNAAIVGSANRGAHTTALRAAHAASLCAADAAF